MENKRKLFITLRMGRGREYYSTRLEVDYKLDNGIWEERDVANKSRISELKLKIDYNSTLPEEMVNGFIPLLENFLGKDAYPIDFLRIEANLFDENERIAKGIENLIRKHEIKKVNLNGIIELK